MKDRQFYPYTREEARKLVRQYFGMTIAEANKYLDGILDFADKYINNYTEWCAYPGKQIAEIDNSLRNDAKKAFYND